MNLRTVLALTLLTAACGGSNDDDDDAPKDAGHDASGEKPSEKDASASAPQDAGLEVKPDQVTNAGEACASAKSCKGEAPTCMTSLTLAGQPVSFPGGYCSAQCGNNNECGADGECPVGESLKDFIGIPLLSPQALANFVPSHCYQPCSSNADCREGEGYRCATIVNALSEGAGGGLVFLGINVGQLLTGPIQEKTYCLPPAPPPASGS